MRFLVHITLFQVRMPRKVQWSQPWGNSRNCVSEDVSLNDKNNTSKTMADIDFQLSDREGVFSWPCGLQCVLNCTSWRDLLFSPRLAFLYQPSASISVQVRLIPPLSHLACEQQTSEIRLLFAGYVSPKARLNYFVMKNLAF